MSKTTTKPTYEAGLTNSQNRRFRQTCMHRKSGVEPETLFARLQMSACRPAPGWLMRQAGRALPEYRALKEKYSFLELVQTPELAAE